MVGLPCVVRVHRAVSKRLPGGAMEVPGGTVLLPLKGDLCMSKTLWLTLVLAIVPVVLAQNGNNPSNDPANDGESSQPVAASQPASPGFGGDLATRRKLTGDWGGVRNQLADKGITIDVDLTNILQGNAHGGAQTNNGLRYSGSTDYTITLDTGKLTGGLWKGGTILLNAESKWGDGIDGKVGSLMPVNLDAHKPGYDEGCMMTLSEYIIFQQLFDGKLVLVAGKLDGSRAFDHNVFANDERTQFMNLAFRNNPLIGAFAPYTNLGAGFILNPTDWLTVTTAVMDSEGRPKTTGFETAFHGPTNTSIVHEYALKLKPLGKEGNYRVGVMWSSMSYKHLQPVAPFKQMGPTLMKLVGPKVMKMMDPLLPYGTESGNAAIYTSFDQWVYNEANDPTQGIGLFGRFGWARQDINPIAHFYSAGVGGKGVLPDRDRDTCGIGYYFVDMSNHMPDMFHSEQGIEAYYNIEITPWLHLSPDFQIVTNPGGTDDHDVSLVYGLRLQTSL